MSKWGFTSLNGADSRMVAYFRFSVTTLPKNIMRPKKARKKIGTESVYSKEY